MAKVSIIIPVYNVEKYLRECLNSVVNQTLKDIEIICVNDGSTDNSASILEEYAKTDNRIKIISQENQGLGRARNAGIKQATSDYIYFLDSDDYIELETIEKMYNKALSLDLDICVCKVREVDVNTNKTRIEENSINPKYLPKQEVFSSLEVKDTIFHLFIGWVWDKLYKKSLIVDNNLTFPPFKNTEDTAFTYMALILSKRISTIRECLINHRTSISTSMSVTRENEPDAFIKAMDLLKNNLEKQNIYNTYKAGFISYFITFSIWHLETISSSQKESLYKKIKVYLKTLNIDNKSKALFIEDYIFDLYKMFCENATYEKFNKAKRNHYKFIEKIFSIKNSCNKKHKVICILGIKICIKRGDYNG